LPWRESTVESGETERSEAETRNGNPGLDPSVVVTANQTQPEIDCIPGLHTDK
jgi:hypothetical protein